MFYHQFLICAAADQYFIVIFLSAQRQVNIFPSFSYLRGGRLIFFRQFLICTAAGQYFFVIFLSAQRQLVFYRFI